MKTLLAALLALGTSTALAQGVDRDNSGGALRWNGTGPEWYATPCGLAGFAFGVGPGDEGGWVRPCSLPVRICEFKSITVQVLALPDPGPECKVLSPMPSGGLVRTQLKTW